MRAAVLAEGGAFDVTTVEDPVAGQGELLLEVSACGLCGSDLKARPAMPAGAIMGHEFGGRVVGVGPARDRRLVRGDAGRGAAAGVVRFVPLLPVR